jgi:hypothetical protein
MSRRPLLFVSGCQHVGSGHTLNFLSSPAGIAVVVRALSRKPFTKVISGNGWQEEAVFMSTCEFWLKGNIKEEFSLSTKVWNTALRTIILSTVLYGCETWSLSLRKNSLGRGGFREQSTENNIWKLKRGREKRSEGRKLHNKQLLNLYP